MIFTSRDKVFDVDLTGKNLNPILEHDLGISAMTYAWDDSGDQIAIFDKRRLTVTVLNARNVSSVIIELQYRPFQSSHLPRGLDSFQ